MKKFMYIMAMILFASPSTEANPQQKLAACKSFLAAEDWTQLNQSLGEFEAEVKTFGQNFQTPYWREYNRIVLETLLQTQEFRRAYSFIYEAARHFYNGLDRYSHDNIYSSEAHAALLNCLGNPGENLRPYAAHHAQEIHELIYAAAFYFMHQDHQNEALFLIYRLLELSAGDTHPDLRALHMKAQLLTANIILNMGQTDKAESVLLTAELGQNVPTTLMAEYYLSRAKVALRRDQYGEARAQLSSAYPFLKKDSSPWGHALMLAADTFEDQNDSTVKRLALYHEAQRIFFSKEKSFERGLALQRLYKLSSQDANYDEEQCRYLTHAHDLAHKKNLPLLWRILEEAEYAVDAGGNLFEQEFESYTDERQAAVLKYQAYPLGENEDETNEAYIERGEKKKAVPRFPAEPYSNLTHKIKATQQEFKNRISSVILPGGALESSSDDDSDSALATTQKDAKDPDFDSSSSESSTVKNRKSKKKKK